MEPELIADYACEVGEGPMWHEAEQRVYWGDIPNGRLYWYDPATGHHGLFYEGDEMIGGYTVQADGSLLLFREKGSIAVLKDGQLEYVVRSLAGEEDNRFNDVVADPRGRVFCGTMRTDVERNVSDRGGTLYRLDIDGSVTPVLTGRGFSNGIGFTPDQKQMYYTDTLDYKIYIFDYDAETGEISNQRDFVEKSEDGGPDGMTVDAEGYVWSAQWDSWSLYRYSPQGQQVRQVKFPARKVSSIVFGGADFSDAYVTTAGGHIKDQDGPLAGSLFRIDLGVKGVPEFTSRIGL